MPSRLTTDAYLDMALRGFQSSAIAQPQPTITTFAPGLDLRSQHRPPSLLSFENLQHLQSTPAFPSATVSAPQDFRLPTASMIHPNVCHTTPTKYAAAFNEPEPYYHSESY